MYLSHFLQVAAAVDHATMQLIEHALQVFLFDPVKSNSGNDVCMYSWSCRILLYTNLGNGILIFRDIRYTVLHISSALFQLLCLVIFGAYSHCVWCVSIFVRYVLCVSRTVGECCRLV